MSSESRSPGTAQYRQAIEGYRTTARWTVTSLGAVAAAAVAGLQLSSVGSLHGWRLWVSIGSFALAILTILVVVAFLQILLAPARGSYSDFGTEKFELLDADLERDPTPLREVADSAVEVADLYRAARKAQQTAWEAAVEQPGDMALRQTLDRHNERAERLYELTQTLTWLGLVLNRKRQFHRVNAIVAAGVVLIAAAATAFAYASSPPAKPAPPAPTVVSVAEPQTCAGLYLTLDELAHRSPRIRGHWPASKLGAQAKSCGLADKAALNRFLKVLTERGR